MSDRNKGVVYMIISAFSFSLMNMFIKLAGTGISSTQKTFFVYIVLAITSSLVMIRGHVSPKISRKTVFPMIWRSIFGCAATIFHYYALAHMNLADASIINKLSPFIVSVACWVLLGEALRLPHVVYMAIAFGGSILIIKPTFDFTAMFPAIMAVCGAFGTGIGYAFIRICMLRGENSSKVVWFYALFTLVILFPYIALTYTPMTPVQIALLLIAGVFSFGGQQFVGLSYKYAPANEVSILNYLNVVFAGIWSLLIWHELPDGTGLIGYAIVFLAAWLMYRYNLRAARANAAGK